MLTSQLPCDSQLTSPPSTVDITAHIRHSHLAQPPVADVTAHCVGRPAADTHRLPWLALGVCSQPTSRPTHKTRSLTRLTYGTHSQWRLAQRHPSATVTRLGHWEPALQPMYRTHVPLQLYHTPTYHSPSALTARHGHGPSHTLVNALATHQHTRRLPLYTCLPAWQPLAACLQSSQCNTARQ